MSQESSFRGSQSRQEIQSKPASSANRTSLLPYILYKNHLKNMEKVQASTDTGLNSPQKDQIIQTKKIRHEMSEILKKKRK